MKISPFTAVEFRLCNVPKLTYSGCNSTFEQPAYLNSGKKMMWKHIFIEFLGKL
jgi:hypothetical protein